MSALPSALLLWYISISKNERHFHEIRWNLGGGRHRKLKRIEKLIVESSELRKCHALDGRFIIKHENVKNLEFLRNFERSFITWHLECCERDNAGGRNSKFQRRHTFKKDHKSIKKYVVSSLEWDFDIFL